MLPGLDLGSYQFAIGAGGRGLFLLKFAIGAGGTGAAAALLVSAATFLICSHIVAPTVHYSSNDAHIAFLCTSEESSC